MSWRDDALTALLNVLVAVVNPIEQVFAKFKILLRKAGARTYDAVAEASAATAEGRKGRDASGEKSAS